MNSGMKLAFRLGLGLMLVAALMICLTPVGSAEFWVSVITASIDALFCAGLALYTYLRRRDK